MKREELTALNLTDEQINAVMKINGDDINATKAKFADYDAVKEQLQKATETIEKMGDYEQTKADRDKYKADAEKAAADYAEKVKLLELQNKVKDFTNDKKFVNELTRNAINQQLEKALQDPGNAGKSMDELLKTLTDGKADIFKDENAPTPPTVPGMNGNATDEDGVTAAFKARNPGLTI